VFADASNNWRLAREEIFGPVLVAIPWRDEADAIRMANDSDYGLAAYVWTHDIGVGLRAAHAIESGWVQVNQGLGQQPGHSLRRLQALRWLAARAQRQSLGVINGVQTFAQSMIDQATPGAIVNTKQGITCPPGNTAYNVTKAGVKVLTEGLAHSLRNVEGCRVSAHLLVPGSTFTGMTRRGRTEKPPSSWMPEQVVDRLIEGMAVGDFYIICPTTM
jgi:NAD(P)-dependent dehydrogenase (short-subunit alcohol dehydrogenase family)